jgi:Tfp pilus assembly protein PilO
MGLQGEVRCVFTEIQDLTRFKSEVRELHRIITLNNPHLQKVARKIKTNLD